MTDDWIQYFSSMAQLAASKSCDPKTRVGAVLVDRHKAVLSTGMNGYPMGATADRFMATLDDRRANQDAILHAEHNALIFADPNRLDGSALFVTKEPCTPCTALICQYRAIYGGPVQIFCPPTASDSQWIASAKLRAGLLRDAGIAVNCLRGAFEIESKV